MRFIILLSCLLVGTAATADTLRELKSGVDSRGWEAVGRLDIDAAGFCTAALITERLILTAAHCIYDENGKQYAPERFTFSAGLRAGRAEAERSVRRMVAHPDYRDDSNLPAAQKVPMDIAVLELDRPIRVSRLAPYDIARLPRRGDEVGVVSYARHRENVPSLEKVCDVLDSYSGMIVMTCDVDFGASGAPVFKITNGVAQIASVISAKAEVDGRKVALGTSLDGPLDVLLAHFASLGPAKPGGTQRIISLGARNDTGAKFVRP